MRRAAGWLSIVACLVAFPAAAAEREPGCKPEVASLRPSIVPAALQANEVRLSFVGHSTFLIESAGGVTIATDYNDYVRPSATPLIATMNRAHNTHYSINPDPGIGQILKGWNPDGGPARHDLDVGDVRIRNVVTNIRDWSGGTIEYGNSIFVFEMADLCIAHLGHLHHALLPEHFAQLGRVDVLLIPVDGNYTMDQDSMMDVANRVHARLMIPMHYFGSGTLNRFLDRARERFAVETQTSPVLVVSQQTLPARPTVLVLPGR